MKRKIILGMLIGVMTLGFRVFPGVRWNIDSGNTKLWVSFCQRPNISTNDLPNGDPLYDQSLTFDLVVNSIFDDFNNVSSAYVTLADQSTDSDYTTSLGEMRTISVCFENPGGTAAGIAQQTANEDQITGCTIKIAPTQLGSAKDFVKTLTHEMGHCLGLDHPQETVHAIMSYYIDNNIIRLQQDDKMGLVHLYPTDTTYSAEEATWGLSCAPQ